MNTRKRMARVSAETAAKMRVWVADADAAPDFVFLTGDNPNGITFVCGACDRDLARDIGDGPVLLNLAFKCPKCGEFNRWETRTFYA